MVLRNMNKPGDGMSASELSHVNVLTNGTMTIDHN